MECMLLLGAILFLLVGHFFKIVRWEKLIMIYERPPVGVLLKAMSLGYALNFFLPFRLGDIFRALFAGRRMKNGVGFSIATIIIDRFLDIVAVTLIFIGFYFAGIRDSTVRESTIFYSVFIVGIITVYIMLGVWSIQIKKAALKVCSIFNDSLKLEGMKFFWSLINTFRDLKKLSAAFIIGSTIGMWFGYMVSYVLFAMFLSRIGNSYSIVEVFIMLFSRASLDISTIGIANIIGNTLSSLQYFLLLYMLLPIMIMYSVTLLPDSLKTSLGRRMLLSRNEDETNYLNMLPQIDSKDQLHFLDEYFNSNNRAYVKKFIDINRNISIIRDYSAGSNATTMLCMNKDTTFYRKYAFGEDGDKLKEQLCWLNEHKKLLPLCEILYADYGSGYCCYDMKYDSNAIGMFRYMHSHPLEDTQTILRAALDILRKQLYTTQQSRADESTVEKYLCEKVDKNLEKIKSSKPLRELLSSDWIIINGKSYKNLPLLEHLFDHDYLKGIFYNDSYSDIHGDLTIENIICLNDVLNKSNAYYIIDPNTGNIHDSQFLDFGKLLQSLHGGYEFMMMNKSVAVTKNHIDFMYTRSAVYDSILEYIKAYLKEVFTEQEVASIFHHEMIHWLRLMPYKLKKDKKRAAMFYAGLIMVANDVESWYG